MDHGPVVPAFGFVFEAAGRRLVLSGDTAPCPKLIEAAEGVDLLVHEVFVHRELPVVAGVRTRETIDRVAGYHTLSGDVGRIVAGRAGARALVLTHFVPPGCDRAALLAEVAADFAGPVIIGEDLLTARRGPPRAGLWRPAARARTPEAVRAAGWSAARLPRSVIVTVQQHHHAECQRQAGELGNTTDHRRADQEAQIGDRADAGDRGAGR